MEQNGKDWEFYLGVTGLAIAGISTIGLATLWYAPMLPELVKHQYDPYPESNLTIQFTEHQYNEVTEKLGDSEEFAWCFQTGEIETDVYEVTSLREGEDMNRSRDSVEFSCDDPDGRVHTHRGRFGVALPSSWDEYIISRHTTGIECIAGNIGGVNCFKNSEGGIKEVEVVT